MTCIRYSLPRFRIPDNHLRAVIVTLLLLRPFAFGTTLLVLVSGNVIVFGADGKGVDTLTLGGGLTPVATVPTVKVFDLQGRYLISTTGAARIESRSHTIYDLETLLKSLPVTNKSGTRDVANMISSACWPIFRDEWAYLSKATKGPLRPFNLSHNSSLPIVAYYIGGNEFLGPEVYLVEIYADWKKQRLNRPIITQIHPPPKGTSTRHNLFATFNGRKGGGMDQLTTDKSPLQQRYLGLHDKAIEALVYDESLDIGSLGRLGRIMLTAEIETNPQSFAFPIRTCSISPGKRAACSDFDH